MARATVVNFFLVGAQTRSLLNFRGALLQVIKNSGTAVSALADASDPGSEQELAEQGIGYIRYPVQRNGMNPLKDLRTYFSLRSIFKKNKPNVVLAYTIKPVIWGGLALRVVPKAKFYALITGLGFAFQSGVNRGWLTRLVSSLYRISLQRADIVIFQNEDNLNEFVQRGIVPRHKCVRVWGSGVDLSVFAYKPKAPDNIPVFLCIGRLLGEKGFHEYAAAASIVKSQYPQARFQWLGSFDPSPDGIKADELRPWQDSGILEYLGETQDVRPFVHGCDVFVLPSYHEGLPRSTLEAMAIGRPVLTTDVSGCRDTVIPGENGFMVPKQNAEALAERMVWFIENPDSWQAMGEASRKMAVNRFDVHKVNAEMLRVMGMETEK